MPRTWNAGEGPALKCDNSCPSENAVPKWNQLSSRGGLGDGQLFRESGSQSLAVSPTVRPHTEIQGREAVLGSYGLNCVPLKIPLLKS